MVIIKGNPRLALLGLLLSAAIFAVLYFTVIKPSSDTANEAVRSAGQQAQQSIKQAEKNGAVVPTGVKKLADCVRAAGADQGELAECQSKYSPN
jgi:flagellar biosynthesis/type III secretory pathway M-ring protein FliF/YscJ